MNKLLVTVTLTLLANLCGAYPIDGYPYTGIRRLDFYSLAQQGIVSGRQLPAGAKYPLQRIQPRFVALESLPTLETDAEHNKKIRSYLGWEKDRYGVVVLDLSDPNIPIYAEHNALYKSNVGSERRKNCRCSGAFPDPRRALSRRHCRTRKTCYGIPGLSPIASSSTITTRCHFGMSKIAS